MFRLTRTFSLTSLVAIVTITAALGWLYRSESIRTLIAHETRANTALAQAVSNVLSSGFPGFLERAAPRPAEAAAGRSEIGRLDRELRQRLEGLRIVRLKIYDLRGVTLYSSDAVQIGDDQSGNAGFQAARAGAAVSELAVRDHFSAFDREIADRSLLSSYVPIRARPEGAVVGVFELYTDVTDVLSGINAAGLRLTTVVAALMTGLYLFLLGVVRRADRVIREQEEDTRRAHQARIDHFTRHDPLTGLLGRALFAEHLQVAARLAERMGRHLGLVYIDLDRFKVINRNLGHEGGDRVLIECAARIRACLRDQDVACRLGGDEFALLLDSLPSTSEAVRVAERLLARLAMPMGIGEREIIVSPSIGIAILPETTRAAGLLITDAAAAMRRAKSTGRNRYVLYDAAEDQPSGEGLDYEMDLRRALANGEFSLNFQPQVDTGTDRLVGVEALLRWQHPARGAVHPDQFMSLLEDTGLVIPVGEWVIDEACRQCRAWHDAGHGGLRVAVNISSRQFRSGSLVPLVQRALAASGLPSECLELELTEGVLIEDIEQAVAQLRELKRLGVQLSIDDFGVGYSSLNYLRHLPIDSLKIDRTFVREITTNPNDAAITEAIVTLARHLVLRVVAEGIETLDQARYLYSLGCTCMQGSLFSEPVAAADFDRLTRPELLRRAGLSGQEPGWGVRAGSSAAT